MKKHLPILLLFLFWGCAGQSQNPKDPPYNAKVDIDLFLSTQDPLEEQKALANLKAHNLTNDIAKTYLRSLSTDHKGLPGQHLTQKINLNKNNYTYSLYSPKFENSSKPLPLVVILHGMGGSGRFTLQKWMERLGDDFIIVCPSYPGGAWWSFRAEDLVFNVIQKVKQKYPVDPNRIILIGLSNGAIGAYMMGMFYPDYFSGIVPIAGAVTERYMHFLVNLGNTPLYSIQGFYDPMFPITYSRRISKILNDMKYPLTYREHKEKGQGHGGHFLPESEVPDLIKWMKSISRQPHPNIIRLVREANHLDSVHWAQVIKGKKMAALQIPGPEGEPVNLKDGKIATLIATHKESNLFELVGKNLLAFKIFLDAERVNFEEPITITFQELKEENKKFIKGPKIVSFKGKVKKSLKVLLTHYKLRRDPELLYDAVIPVSLEEDVQFAFRHGNPS